jgi:plasmid stabilization system protein ParE
MAAKAWSPSRIGDAKVKIQGTRELTFSPLPYIAVYLVKGDTVEILHIWHGAQDR